MDTINYLQNIHDIEGIRKLLNLLYLHSDEFPMCYIAYRRKMKVGYASVCECCPFCIYYDLYTDSHKSGCESLSEYQWLNMAIKLNCSFEMMKKYLDKLIEKFGKIKDDN